MIRKTALLLLGAAALVPMQAYAQAVITNGAVSVGVDSYGQLGVGGTGITDNRTGWEAITPGCICEGWGAANGANGVTGYANNSSGTSNVSLVSFASTASTATSVVNIAGATPMQVTHAFAPSASADLYQVNVSITNTGASAINSLLYRRVMDWDVEPTAFTEYVTLQGVGASALAYSSDNGFASANPLIAGSSILPGTVNTNFVDSGPADHGALFDFNFGSLAAGATKNFSIFYGASLSEAAALLALSTVGAEVYSLGQSSDNISGSTARRSTFVFGFAGVGGTPVTGGVPEPTTWAMMLLGFGFIGGAMRSAKRRQKLTVTYA